jgi:hypothetical protein
VARAPADDQKSGARNGREHRLLPQHGGRRHRSQQVRSRRRFKAGWTAWTAAAVDKRVAAVMPLVIDLLNIEISFEHHYRAYGFWAPSIAAYQASGIMRWAGTAELALLLT